MGVSYAHPPHNTGVWLSLAERCVRDAEVVGSNPATPTTNQGPLKLGVTTGENYTKLLEAVFLVHRLLAWGTTLKARAAANPKIHVVDSGSRHGSCGSAQAQRRPGPHFIGGVALYTGLRAYTPEDRIHVMPVDRLWTPSVLVATEGPGTGAIRRTD